MGVAFTKGRVPARVRQVGRRLKLALHHPSAPAYHVLARRSPEVLFARQSDRARSAGLDRVYFILSFDCDTARDAQVAEVLHRRMLEMGVQPVYAVPGELLLAGEHVYRGIAATGGEFINHGGRSHAAVDPGTGDVVSTLFYDTLAKSAVVEDIEAGHRLIRDVLDLEAVGFRTPHLATFQRPAQLRFLHQTLQRLRYRFSTSTMPFWSYRHGPKFSKFGLVEFPVSGMVSAPMQALDTWTCFAEPNRKLTPEDYRCEVERLGCELARGGAGIVNLYGDPSHIHDSQHFFAAVTSLLEVCTATTYSELLLGVR